MAKWVFSLTPLEEFGLAFYGLGTMRSRVHSGEAEPPIGRPGLRAVCLLISAILAGIARSRRRARSEPGVTPWNSSRRRAESTLRSREAVGPS